MKMIRWAIWGLAILWQSLVFANHEVSDEKLIQATAELSKQVVLASQFANADAKNQAFKQINQALMILGWSGERPTTGGFIDGYDDGRDFQPMVNLVSVLQKVMGAISTDSTDVVIYNGMISTAKVQILTQLQASCGKAAYNSERSQCMMRALAAINAQEAMIDIETAKLSIVNGCKAAPYNSERAICYNTSIETTQSQELIALTAGCKAISTDSSKSSCYLEALSQ